MKKFFTEPTIEKLNLQAEAITSGLVQPEVGSESGYNMPEA